MTTMFLGLEIHAINIVAHTQARVKIVSEDKTIVTIDVVSMGATIDIVLAEVEMGATTNQLLTRAKMEVQPLNMSGRNPGHLSHKSRWPNKCWSIFSKKSGSDPSWETIRGELDGARSSIHNWIASLEP